MAYYLVRGNNGVIIHYNFYKAQVCQRYIHKSSIQKFQSFDDAEEAALEHLTQIIPYYIPIPERIEINQMITRAMLDRADKERRRKHEQEILKL